MILGVFIGSIGAGFLSRINVYTPTLYWAAWSVVTGIGIGTGRQQPYTAVQLVLTYVRQISEVNSALTACLAKMIFQSETVRSSPNHRAIFSSKRFCSCHGLLHPTWRVYIPKSQSDCLLTRQQGHIDITWPNHPSQRPPTGSSSGHKRSLGSICRPNRGNESHVADQRSQYPGRHSRSVFRGD